MEAPEAKPTPVPPGTIGTPTSTPTPTPVDTTLPPTAAPLPIPPALDVSTAALAAACVLRVQQAVPAAGDVRILADRAGARSTLRPDGLHVVEVPYTADGPAGSVPGSYICGMATTSGTLEFRFFSDHERMNATQWSEYASTARPGNLDLRA